MEERVKELEQRVSDLSARVGALEGLAPPPRSAVPSPAPGELPSLPDLGALAPSVALFGRSLLVVGGAFLIRAITDKDLVAHEVGVALGIAFATVWVALAWREAGLGRALSATFLGVTASLIGFPLIAESATRLELVSSDAAAAILCCFATALLAAAAHRRLRLVAWVGVLGATVTAGVLLRAPTASPIALSGALVLLFAGTLVLADLRDWTGPRWVTALVTDGVVTRGVFSAAALPETAQGVGPSLVLSTLTVLVTLAFIARRTLGPSEPDGKERSAPQPRSNLGAFEVVQTALAIALGLGTSARSGDLFGWVPPLAGAVALLFAAGALITCVKLSERAHAGFEVWFHGGAGLALLLGGGLLFTSGPLLALLWAGLGLGAAVLARRSHTATLWTVSVALGWAAAVSGGLLSLARDALLARPEAQWQLLSAPRVVILALLLATYLSMAIRPPAVGKAVRTLPAALLCLVSIAVTAAFSYVLRAASGGAEADAGVVALLRTLVMVAGVVALGVSRRLGGPVEMAWIAWCGLGSAGLKMLGQDLQAGRPSTLFIAFLALGGGILALPLLMRPPRSPREP